MKPLISLLTTIHYNRSQQFNLSIQSLSRQNYDKELIELVVIIDCDKKKKLLKTLTQNKRAFKKIKCYFIENESSKITHSVTRRNFLAREASGRFIMFVEPEMLHIGETINYALKFARNNFQNYWYCGPVYATESIVKSDGEINVDECQNKENIKLLLSLIKNDLKLKNAATKKFYFRINEKSFPILYFCAMFYRDFFINLGGLNEKLRVRGWEEIELFERFKSRNGKFWFDKNFKTVHLPHKRSLNIIHQIGWNLFNSTITFNVDQKFGDLNEKVLEVLI